MLIKHAQMRIDSHSHNENNNEKKSFQTRMIYLFLHNWTNFKSIVFWTRE